MTFKKDCGCIVVRTLGMYWGLACVEHKLFIENPEDYIYMPDLQTAEGWVQVISKGDERNSPKPGLAN